jgi:inosine-uridine nucleoside N-ribohydrolase
MQLGQGRPPVGIIYDSDLGNRIDGVLALATLYGLDGKNECRVISITISKPSLQAAAFGEVIGRFYSGAVSGAFNAAGRTLPIGLATEGPRPDETPMMKAVLEAKTPDGKVKYENGIHSINDTAEPHAVIRNAFTSQYDQNCIVVVAGPATNVVRAMDLPGSKSLIERKVRTLVMMGGDFAGGPPETNIKADIPSARKLFAEWPGEIIVCGNEVGSALRFPAAAIENDFAWSQAHPVVDAYRAAETMPYDAGTQDVIAVLAAVRPKEDYFKLSAPGVITVDNEGRTKFTASANGKHRYISVDPAQKERVVEALVTLASAKPVIRSPRFRPPVEKKPEAAPAKPPAQ